MWDGKGGQGWTGEEGGWDGMEGGAMRWELGRTVLAESDGTAVLDKTAMMVDLVLWDMNMGMVAAVSAGMGHRQLERAW